jgi:hypothetical protein
VLCAAEVIFHQAAVLQPVDGAGDCLLLLLVVVIMLLLCFLPRQPLLLMSHHFSLFKSICWYLVLFNSQD